MTKLPTQEFRRLVPLLRQKEFYHPQTTRHISWPEYNASQIMEAKETLAFIRESVDNSKSLLLIGKRGKPLTDAKVLAKAVLVCEYMNMTERQAEGWLDIIGPFLGIYQHLDDRVIGDAYEKMEVIYILKQVFDVSKTSDGILCGDGTGMETTRKQNYESNKNAGRFLTSIVDSREIVQAFDASGLHERKAMHELIEQVDGKSLRLDAGFVDRELVQKLGLKGIKPFIFPKKNLSLKGEITWKVMYMELYHDVMQWLKEYHIRSHSESFHSSLKRRNKPLSKRREARLISQITARIILHNIRRLSYSIKLANTS